MKEEDIPDELIKLERSSEEERAKLAELDGDEFEAQRLIWRTAAVAFQAAVTEYATRDDVIESRHVIEMAVKKAVRQPVTV